MPNQTCPARLWLETPTEPDGFYIYCEKPVGHGPSQSHATLNGFGWSVPDEHLLGRLARAVASEWPEAQLVRDVLHEYGKNAIVSDETIGELAARLP